MKVIIVTSNRRGTASFCLQLLMAKANCEIVKVVLNQDLAKKKWPFYKRKIKKIFRIGVLGAVNGIRIRKWFTNDHVGDVILQDIEVLCKQHGIPFETTPSLNSERTVEALRSCQPDLGLSLGNSYIASKVFSIPRYGMLNIHGEVLPDFQNAQSVIWQIYEGKGETGYTIHKINKGIDTGDIVKQERFPIVFMPSLAETVNENSKRILQRSAEGLITVINDFDFHFKNAYKQGKVNTYTTPTFWQFQKIKRQFKKLSALSKNSYTK
jgi:methionyl-tRNA formyltransferase